MEKWLLSLLLSMCSYVLCSQEFEGLCYEIKNITRKDQYDPLACEIFMATGSIFSQSYNENKSDTNYAMESVVRWLKGTKDYHLIVGGKILEDCDKGDYTMKNIFKVCMLEFLFENHEYVHSSSGSKLRYINIHEVREIIFGGAQLFMEYLSKQDKKIINKKLQKGLKLYYAGKLQEYMDS